MTVCLGEHRNEKYNKHRQQWQPVPGPETAALLGHNNIGQVQGPDAHQHRDYHETNGDFVRHHLCRRAQRSEKGVFRIARPARHDNAVDTERRDREQVENADIDIRQHPAGIEWDDCPGDQAQDKGQHRREDKHDPVGARRNDRFLEQQFHAVGDRLKQTERANDIGAFAELHRRNYLAFGERQISNCAEQRQDNQQNLANDDDTGPEIYTPEFSHRCLSFRSRHSQTSRYRPPSSRTPG